MLFSKTKICIFNLKSINPQNMGGLTKNMRGKWSPVFWMMYGRVLWTAALFKQGNREVCSKSFMEQAHLLVLDHNISCESLPVRDVQVWELMRRWRERKKTFALSFLKSILNSFENRSEVWVKTWGVKRKRVRWRMRHRDSWENHWFKRQSGQKRGW